MLDAIKKSLGKMDWLILALAAYIFVTLDYDNLTTFNKIYIGSFVLWLAMLAARVYIVKRNGEK